MNYVSIYLKSGNKCFILMTDEKVRELARRWAQQDGTVTYGSDRVNANDQNFGVDVSAIEMYKVQRHDPS